MLQYPSLAFEISSFLTYTLETGGTMLGAPGACAGKARIEGRKTYPPAKRMR